MRCVFAFQGNSEVLKRMDVRYSYTLWFSPKLALLPEETLNMKSTCLAKALPCSVKSEIEGWQELCLVTCQKPRENAGLLKSAEKEKKENCRGLVQSSKL